MRCFAADRIVAEAREHTLRLHELPDRNSKRAQEAVTYARDKQFERESVVDERVLLREALRRGMGETTLPEIRASYEGRREAGEFLDVPQHEGQASREITTRETIAAEHDVLKWMQDGQKQLQPIVAVPNIDLYDDLE